VKKLVCLLHLRSYEQDREDIVSQAPLTKKSPEMNRHHASVRNLRSIARRDRLALLFAKNKEGMNSWSLCRDGGVWPTRGQFAHKADPQLEINWQVSPCPSGHVGSNPMGGKLRRVLPWVKVPLPAPLVHAAHCSTVEGRTSTFEQDMRLSISGAKIFKRFTQLLLCMQRGSSVHPQIA
jgi:hypothetical protein